MWTRVNQKRQNINFGVPEVLAFISMPGQALGGHTHAVCTRAGLIDVKEIEARDLLDLVIASNFHVGPGPERKPGPAARLYSAGDWERRA